jgi:hypothetical protein
MPPPPIAARSFVTRLRQPIPIGDPYIGEEHLVEVGGAGDLLDGSHLDTGAPHVDDEVRETGVLRRIEIAARDENPPVGVMGS